MKTLSMIEKDLFLKESSISGKFPYSYFIDESTLELRNGNLMQIIKVDGLCADTLDDSVRFSEKNFRNQILMSISDSSTAIYFYTLRKKSSVLLSGSYQDGFLSDLNEKWNNKLSNDSFFINENYIVLVYKQPEANPSHIFEIFQSLTNKYIVQEKEDYRIEALKRLNRKIDQIISGLSQYGSCRLINEDNSSEIMKFLSYLATMEDREISLPLCEISNALTKKRYFFDSHSGVFAIRGIDNKSKYCAMLSIENYNNKTIAGMFDYLLDMKGEMIVAQSFSPLERIKAQKALKERKRNMEQSDDGSSSASDKINDMLDALATDSVVYGHNTFNICVFADTQNELNENILSVDRRLSKIGIMIRREDIGLKPAFFSMFPGNQAFITRQGIVTSLNAASLCSLHNASIGKRSGNHWGDAVTVLETISGSPYFFNFHVLDVGNTFMIGSQGSGKTLLESFLLAMSMKFGGRAVIFDKDRGMEIFVRAQGGQYDLLQVGKPTGFAPFQLDDSKENRYFLHKLLRRMAEISGITVDSEIDVRLTEMIQGAYMLPKQDRILRNVVAFSGMKQVGSLRYALENWVNQGCFAWLFDNEVDLLSLESPVIGFDMTSIFDEEVVVGIVYYYLFHRIEKKIDGSPMRIVCAEGWKALRDSEFQKKIQDWSSTPRKKNALLIIDTQTPDDISKSETGCKVIQESVTQIYFANPKASYDDYVVKFKLTEKEYEIIKNLDKKSRFFLLKHGQHSVIVRADLTEGFDDEIAILSSRTSNLNILDKIRDEYGDVPNDWLPRFKIEMLKQRNAKK